MIITLLIFFTFFSLIFQFVENNKINVYLIFIFSLSLFYFFTYGVTDTADWEGYIYKFDDTEASTDIIFRYLTLLAVLLGYSFEVIYQFHLMFFGFLFAFFISRFTKNIFLVLIFYLVISYVPLVNQIRYYLALSFFFNSMYFMFCSKRRTLSIVLLIFSVLSHSSMFILCLFPILSHLSTGSNYLKRCIYASIGFFFVVFSFITLGISNFLNHYDQYFGKEMTSSVLGGIFNVLPHLIFLIFLYLNNEKAVEKYPDLLEDTKYKFLYRLSFFTVIFIPASLYIQVLAHRYVHALLIVWICLYLYTLSFEKLFKPYFYGLLQLLLMLFFIIGYTYILSPMLFGEEGSYRFEFVRSFNSIDYLPDIK
jgi:hypothetical protein